MKGVDMHRIAKFAVSAAILLFAACQDVRDPTAPGGSPSLLIAPGPQQRAVIVVFHDHVTGVQGLARAMANQAGGSPTFIYENALKGFAGGFPEAGIEALRRNPNVAFVEADQVMTISTTQSNATWGLDRIDQRDRPLNATYVHNADGSGVRAYIIDTGILATHTEFTGRMLAGYDAVTSGGSANDCNGHGTHVAGTVGGTTWGVAKNVRLVPVRVLGCTGSGTTSGVIAGVDWVTANHVKPAVANLSLGGGASSALDNAVANSIAAGVTYAVAAGNSNADACNYSPARTPTALTVGATTSSDARASYSNFGGCLDIFAPGTSITSAWHTSTNATNTISGTSMASPHVAGVAALILQGSPTNTPSQVGQEMIALASTGKVSSAGTGSPNRLLYMATIGGSGGGAPTNQTPNASFTFSCVDLTCNFNGAGSSDPDGTIVAYQWNFGDGTSSSAVSPSKSYSSAGTRTVTLTVTDNVGATDSESKSVGTTAPSTGINLTVTVTKVKRVNTARLSWNGATSSVDVFRGGAKIATVSGTTYSDSLGRGGGTQTYQVCNAGTSTCSNPVAVTY